METILFIAAYAQKLGQKQTNQKPIKEHQQLAEAAIQLLEGLPVIQILRNFPRLFPDDPMNYKGNSQSFAQRLIALLNSFSISRLGLGPGREFRDIRRELVSKLHDHMNSAPDSPKPAPPAHPPVLTLLDAIDLPGATSTEPEPEQPKMGSLRGVQTTFILGGREKSFMGGQKFASPDGSEVIVHSIKNKRSLGRGAFGNVRLAGMLVTGNKMDEFRSHENSQSVTLTNGAPAIYISPIATKKVELQRIKADPRDYKIVRHNGKKVAVFDGPVAPTGRNTKAADVEHESSFLAHPGLSGWVPRLFHFSKPYTGILHLSVPKPDSNPDVYPAYKSDGTTLIPITGEKAHVAQTYLVGLDLVDWVVQSRDKSPEKKIRITLQILAIVLKLQQLKVAHKDIKLENFFLTKEGHLKIVDFGLSAHFHERGRLTKNVGTAAYKAPEVLRYGADQSKSDLYSAAATAWGLWTEDEIENLNPRTMKQDLVRSRCPEILRAIILQCIKPNPGSRPSPEDILEALSEDEALWDTFLEVVNEQDPEWFASLVVNGHDNDREESFL